MEDTSYKIQKSSGSKLKQYGELVVGSTSFWVIFRYELITFLFGSLPGAIGLLLRSIFYPFLFKQVGQGVVFGRGLTLRHPMKISIGEGSIIDDYCLLDAKGSSNTGIQMGQNVFIGRSSSIYCKNGDIILEDHANIGHLCILFSTNLLKIGKGTMVAAYSYLLSGGHYTFGPDEKSLVEQSGNITDGATEVGDNCWIGTKAVILDHASIGNNSVIGAGAVVNKPIPENSLAVGIPAKVIKTF